MQKKAVIEAVKSALRLAVMAALGVFIQSLVGYFSSIDNNVIAVAAVFVLKGVDKWIHENKNLKANGLIPF